MIGAELEYFLVREKEDGSIELADPLDRLDQPCYDMRGLTRNLDFMSQVSRYVTDYGWNNYANDHEDANGQFEQNFDFADALTTADRAIFFRYMVESLAQERGMVATFMPKPFGHLTGNGCHFHMSLWKDGENVFEVADPSDDPRGLGLSELAYSFIGGLKAHAKAYIALTAPTVSSYKRLKTGTRSGSSWAPVFVSYGFNNRTQMLRIPAAGRIEDRTVDGSCNPYLAATAVLAAGLDGIEKGLDPGDPTTELNLHEVTEEQRKELGVELLPANLLDATRELEQDEVLRAALGSTSARGLRGLLREDEAGRVGRVAQRGHSVGDQALSPAVLEAHAVESDHEHPDHSRRHDLEALRREDVMASCGQPTAELAEPERRGGCGEHARNPGGAASGSGGLGALKGALHAHARSVADSCGSGRPQSSRTR